MNDLFLGIDLGTGSCKLTLIDAAGRFRDSESASYPTYSPQPGWMEQNPEDWISAVSLALRGLLCRVNPACIKSISLTSAAHIGVLMDRDCRVIRNALLWNDQRSVAQVQKLRSMADRIYALTGNSVSTSWTLPHFLWVRETEPELWKTVRHICFSKDSILHWLTGKWVTDPATAVASLLFDINLMSWSAELCSVLGIPPDSMCGMLPCVRAADTCAGSILPQIAAEFGLSAAVSVLTGTLDSATETYGAGASKPGDVVIRIGTAGGIHKLSAVPIENRKLLTYPFPKGNIWYSQAGTNAAGAAVGWAVGLVSEKSGPAFDNFDKAAGSVPPGSENLFFLPFLSGERTPYWNPDLRGTFLGLSFHHTKAHMARAVLEGVAYSLTDALQTIISDGELPETVTVVGGGTKDGLLMKILSSILNRRLSVLPDVDSAYGTALLCLGDVPLQCQSHTTVIEPDQEWSCFYRNGFTKYKKNCMLIANVYS